MPSFKVDVNRNFCVKRGFNGKNKKIAQIIGTISFMIILGSYVGSQHFYQRRNYSKIDIDNIIKNQNFAYNAVSPSYKNFEADDQEILKQQDNYLRQYSNMCFDPQKNGHQFENIPLSKATDCATPFVTEMGLGRFGNRVCSLMSLWIFRKHFGSRIMISDESYFILSSVFTDLRVRHGFNWCFNWWSAFNTKNFTSMYNEYFNSLNFIKKEKSTSPILKKYNILDGYPCATNFFIPYRDELRKFFVINPDLLRVSKSILEKLLELRNLRRSNTTLVSVHVRRTDYIHHSKLVYDIEVPDVNYYRRALNIFRKRLKNPQFLIISDDVEWCYENLNEPDTIIPTGFSSVEDPSIDFVLMTLCDHHIIGLGTFAFTSAFLGNGTIGYDLSSKNVIKYYDFESPGLLCSDRNIYIPI